MAGDLAEVAFGAVFVAAVIAVQWFTSWWCMRTHPGIGPVLIVQAPFPLLYGMTLVWFKVGFSASDGGPPSLWYLPWAAIASISLSWLIVYRLTNLSTARVSKVFVPGLVLWLVIHGGGFALDRWNSSNGFGLKGYPTAAEAFSAFTATSCLFDLDWYRKGGKSFEAQCAKYDQHADNGPADGFSATVSTGQPQEALTHWWDAMHQFRELQPLKVQPGMSTDSRGNIATVRLRVSSPPWPRYGDKAGYHCFPDGREETWTVHLETVAFGGWKVARVDVDRAVTVVPFVGSACDRSP